MARPTIRDVAKKAGVGIGTVSRVLNNSAHVSAQTRDRVLQAIQELQFRPNIVAQQLPRKTRLTNLGVLTQPFISYRSFAERLRGIQAVISETETDYEIVLYSVSSLSHFDEQLKTITYTRLVEGLIIIDFDLTDEQLDDLERSNIPFVGLNNYQSRTWPCIGTDNVEGGYIATKHLIELGHERIAYIGDAFYDDFVFQTSTERYEGYEKALKNVDVDIRDEYVLLGAHGFDTAKSLMHQLLELPEPPTAVFAMSDIQALGCIAAIQECGLCVPDDISVIGYDDLEIAYLTGLTTVRQHLALTGRQGVLYLLSSIAGDTPDATSVLPPVKVITRQTTQTLSE